MLCRIPDIPFYIQRCRAFFAIYLAHNADAPLTIPLHTQDDLDATFSYSQGFVDAIPFVSVYALLFDTYQNNIWPFRSRCGIRRHTIRTFS